MRRKALDRERTSDANDALSLDGPVVEQFDIGVARDGGIDFALPLASRTPPRRMIRLRDVGPFVVGLARDLPFFPAPAERVVELGSQGFELKLERSQMTSISALLAMLFSVTCGVRS
jgi:hypothetical protein